MTGENKIYESFKIFIENYDKGFVSFLYQQFLFYENKVRQGGEIFSTLGFLKNLYLEHSWGHLHTLYGIIMLICFNDRLAEKRWRPLGLGHSKQMRFVHYIEAIEFDSRLEYYPEKKYPSDEIFGGLSCTNLARFHKQMGEVNFFQMLQLLMSTGSVTVDALTRHFYFDEEIFSDLPRCILENTIFKLINLISILDDTIISELITHKFTYSQDFSKIFSVSDQLIEIFLISNLELRCEELGLLLVGLYRLSLLGEGLPKRQKKWFLQDLREIQNEQYTIEQRLNTMHRMYGIYSFLAIR